jgi:hypothetical protein
MPRQRTKRRTPRTPAAGRRPGLGLSAVFLVATFGGHACGEQYAEGDAHGDGHADRDSGGVDGFQVK